MAISENRGTGCLLGECTLDKNHFRMDALGSFDELNSFLGIAASLDSGQAKHYIEAIQNDLFTFCAELVSPNIKNATKLFPKITAQHLEDVEGMIQEVSSRAELSNSFVLPGGVLSAGLLDYARSVARRAERALVRLSKQDDVRPEMLKYANRVSHLLYLLARLSNKGIVREQEPIYRHFEK